jgi:XRE family transcriptional regulator, regulator of sulfur utilization
MVPTPKQIGRTLKRLRMARGLTRYALAKQAGISREYVTKLEAGRSDPTVGMLGKLAKVLDVPVARFLE